MARRLASCLVLAVLVAWGHTGDWFGSDTEFWHLVKESVTIAVTWNDEVIEGNSGIFQGLVRAAV